MFSGKKMRRFGVQTQQANRLPVNHKQRLNAREQPIPDQLFVNRYRLRYQPKITDNPSVLSAKFFVPAWWDGVADRSCKRIGFVGIIGSNEPLVGGRVEQHDRNTLARD